MALEIWLPPSARAKPEKVYRCGVCGEKTFPANQRSQWMRHVGACFRANEDGPLGFVERQKASAFTGVMDVEHHRWNRKRKRERPGENLNRAQRRARKKSK